MKFFTLMALAVPAIAGATVYFSQDSVASALLAGVRLKPMSIELSSEERQKIEAASGEKVRYPKIELRLGPRGQVLFYDKVIGKHNNISYALALSSEGKILGLEIMEYLENYGGQVRAEPWRAGFIGKGREAGFKVGKDIDAISGATISATHVSGGVRRLLATYELIKGRLK